MPTAFQIIFGLIVLLLALGALSAIRRKGVRREHGKELGRAKPGDRADL